MRHHMWKALVVSMFCVALAGVRAQPNAGGIRGVVTDSTNSALPGVTVTLSRAAHTDRVVITDEQGAFAFLALEPGRYAVTVSLAGFRPTTSPVTITAGATVALSLRLEVDGIAETVTVTAVSP